MFWEINIQQLQHGKCCVSLEKTSSFGRFGASITSKRATGWEQHTRRWRVNSTQHRQCTGNRNTTHANCETESNKLTYRFTSSSSSSICAVSCKLSKHFKPWPRSYPSGPPQASTFLSSFLSKSSAPLSVLLCSFLTFASLNNMTSWIWKWHSNHLQWNSSFHYPSSG